MKTAIRLDRENTSLKLTHLTDAGTAGTLVISLLTNLATERVHDLAGNLLHEATFPASRLGGSDTDLEPYLIGMTRSAG